MRLGLGARIERYILFRGLFAFVLTTLVLTVIVWMTQALGEIDLITAKGQTLQLFLLMSSLAVPSLIVVLAPVALLIATIYVMNSLHSDSELVIISASGGSPKRVTRPILWLSLFVALITGVLSVYVAPSGLQQLRGFVTQVRADLISSIMVPGAFTDIDRDLMVHIKDRNADGSLAGILISDTRDPGVSFKYLAQRGALVETGPNTYLVMQNGNIIRRETQTNSSSIIEFASYGFDLSQFKEAETTSYYRTKERGTFDLLQSLSLEDLSDKDFSAFRAEVHGRFVAPLYAFAFAMIAMLVLASPQTTRSGRGMAILMTVVIAVLVRGVGFTVEGLVEAGTLPVMALYLVPLIAVGLALFLLWRNVRLDFASRFAERAGDIVANAFHRWAKRFRQADPSGQGR